MPHVTLVTLVLIAASVLVSMRAFGEMKAGRSIDRFLFAPAYVIRGQRLQGLLLSCFSHADGTHLAFNMIALVFFGPVVEAWLGPWNLLLIYVCSEIGATLLSLASHHHDPDYRSLGASGAISGVLFAAIVLEPTMSIGLVFIPIPIPAPIFAVLYMAYSVFGARSRLGNVGHEAHLGGAATGFLMAAGLSPDGLRTLGGALRDLVS